MSPSQNSESGCRNPGRDSDDGTALAQERGYVVYGPGNVFKRKHSRFWQIEFWVKGKRHTESARSIRKVDAQSLLQKRIEQYRLVPGLVPKALVSDIVADYLLDCERREVVAVTRFRWMAKSIDAFCGHELAREFDSLRAYEFQQRLVEKGLAGASVNQTLSIFRTALKLAARNGKIPLAPEFPRRLPEAPPRQGFLEHRDFVAIREELPPWAQDVFSYAYFSGWRRMEILTLRWSEVDLDGGVIRLDPRRSKTKHGRLLPLRGEIGRIVQSRVSKRVLGLDFVFHRDGVKISPTTWFKWFSRAREIAGRPKTLLHDTRRTAVRNLVRAGVPDRVAMQFTGHLSRAVFDRYSITNPRDMDEAADKLAKYIDEKAALGEMLKFTKKEGREESG